MKPHYQSRKKERFNKKRQWLTIMERSKIQVKKKENTLLTKKVTKKNWYQQRKYSLDKENDQEKKKVFRFRELSVNFTYNHLHIIVSIICSTDQLDQIEYSLLVISNAKKNDEANIKSKLAFFVLISWSLLTFLESYFLGLFFSTI